ncbi:MAG: nicotinate phosphoribosyltransferase [Chloroflexi bacterium]|nr:nicotinate phosphoribosyltransferase [Chloroflexota bacterium]
MPREFDVGRPVLVGDTADAYLHRTLAILRNEGLNPEVVMQFVPESKATICGMTEVRALLTKVLPENAREVWAIDDGTEAEPGLPILRIKAPYASFGLYETAICGMVAQSTGWATAARECVEAAGGIPVVSMGARYVHPSVVGFLDYAAIVGRCVSATSVIGSRMAGLTPSGTMAHSLVLIMGDTLKAAQALDRHMPPEVPRVALVDTFRDEAQDAIEVAKALNEKLRGIRLDTVRERGGVTPALVKEVRARLDQAGFGHVDIFVTGGLDPGRIRGFVEEKAPVSVFGVGRHIAGAPPIFINADIHEVAGQPMARRGRIPGITPNPKLVRIL